MLRHSETRVFFYAFYKVHHSEKCAPIGQLYSALWLAEYLKREMEMLRPLPYCDAVSRRNDTKTINHYKWGICCIQWGHGYWL